MTSILTNTSAISALQTLRSIGADLDRTQGRMSSGLRVEDASDNAAYWSIATTMRSDTRSLSAISDALGLGSATADTAYAGLEAVIDILGDFSAKLVASKEPGVDKAKVQAELNQYKQTVMSIAQSASFSGENWLKTDFDNIYDDDLTRTNVMASVNRDVNGHFSAQTIDFYRSEVALFNSTGGGLLQRDIRDVGTIGGMRELSGYSSLTRDHTLYVAPDGTTGWMYPRGAGGTVGAFSLAFPKDTPLDFTVPGAEISFTLTLDTEASNPDNRTGTAGDLQSLPGPFDPGFTTNVSITRADVDAYSPALGGVIRTNEQFAAVLNAKINPLGASIYASYNHYDPPTSNNWVHDPVAMMISTRQQHGNGSYVEISNLASSGVSTGGLVEASDWGSRGSGMELAFQPFILHEDGENTDGIAISFAFSVNGAPATSHSFDRTYVNTLLNKDTGKVETAGEMATLLHSLLDQDWPNLIIEPSAGGLIVQLDPAADRTWGSRTNIGFDQIRVSIEPLPVFDFMDIDIAAHPERTDSYINYLDIATQRIIDGAANLGALQARIDLQSDFVDTMMEANRTGIGRLVDADMNDEASRMKALQVQEQLGIQALQIANSRQDSLLQLFN